ncbi:MAG: PilZ domain-containing protein [Desulfococcaceae bacterium]
MRILTQRSFTRNHFQAPILFTPCTTEEECAAVMHNSSVGGMYFEANRPMAPGEGVVIRMADFTPDPYWPEASDHYVGEVRWCVEREADPDPVYGIGVRFVATICKDCGHMSLEPTSYTFSNVVDVCPECLAHIENLSEGKLKESIRCHLLGNVV